MYILGLNCYSHNASASLIKDGEIRAAIEEERIDRKKHSSAFPRHAIRKCLEFEGIGIDDIDRFTFFCKPLLEVAGNFFHVLRHFPGSLQLFRSAGMGEGEAPMRRIALQYGIAGRLKSEFGLKSAPRVEFVEHHLCHAASAFFPSRFEEAAILTWDGRGERATTLMAMGRGNRIEKIDEILLPNSLGLFYAAITSYLGFDAFFDEWKVMGMAAYGSDEYIAPFRDLVRLEAGGKFRLNLDYFSFHTHGQRRWLSDRFPARFGPARTKDAPLEKQHFSIARALQETVEIIGLHVARHLYETTRAKALCMTGGVALNVLLNRRIVEETPFEHFFIQPVAGDAGTSVGSALYHFHQTHGGARKAVFESAYLGPEYTPDQIEAELKGSGLKYARSENIEREAAGLIADGKIVGWFQNRMEAGPRALGNRSIVADPRDPRMKERLNGRVKRREWFRPFAPSVLEERAADFFDMPKNQSSPYMILAGRVRADKMAAIPAVTHVDGSARVHTVSRNDNPRYWKLIHEFEKLSGVGVLLNTSFNENEPIVCSPKDAVACFNRADFDVLGIGDFIATKS